MFAGEDSTEEFEDSFHSEEAREQMKDYVIGYVEVWRSVKVIRTLAPLFSQSCFNMRAFVFQAEDWCMSMFRASMVLCCWGTIDFN